MTGQLVALAVVVLAGSGLLGWRLRGSLIDAAEPDTVTVELSIDVSQFVAELRATVGHLRRVGLVRLLAQFTRRARLTYGRRRFVVQVFTGRPTWWTPRAHVRTRQHQRAVIVGWFRVAVGVAWVRTARHAKEQSHG